MEIHYREKDYTSILNLSNEMKSEKNSLTYYYILDSFI